MKGFFRTMFLAGLVVLAVLCCGCGRESAGAWEAVDVAMGTMVRLKVYGPEEERAGEIFSQAREILQSLEEDELSWRLETSEVYRINASAGDGKGEALSAEMAQVLQTCLELYEKSEGAFDVTLGALVRLWKIDSWAGGAETGEFQAPSAGSLEEALGRCGSSMVGLLPKDSWQEGTRLLLPEGMQLDLGAVGKGLALSRILELLEEEPEVSGAVVYLGGSVLTYGSRPDGGSWKIGIADPSDPSSSVGILTREGQWCVSTSGDYERYVERDGVRWHHILDPATGLPADSGVRSATILSRDGLLGDGLSTACFILGPEKGLELAGEYGAEVLFILDDGEFVMSEGMEAFFSEAGRQGSP